MNQRLLAEIGRTQRLEIVNSLKRTKGMSVNELVEKMGMSYMGIKQHCLTLQRDGYLDTWRRPQKMGRPEMAYRLTRSSHDLYPVDRTARTRELLKSNSPIFNVLEKYPIIGRLEQDMFEAVLGTSVRREETRTSGLYQCAFYFAA